MFIYIILFLQITLREKHFFSFQCHFYYMLEDIKFYHFYFIIKLVRLLHNLVIRQMD